MTATMDPITKLYRHDCDYDCCPSRWSKHPNHEEDQKHLQQLVADDPIIHRHEFSDNQWITYSFTIQSSLMREHLRAALHKYQDFDPELSEWTFKPPFQPIVHRWDQLNDISDKTTESAKKEAIDQLLEFLRPILGPSIDALTKTKLTGKVSFEDLWQIFTPGELAMTAFFDVEAACRMTKYERKDPGQGRPPYYIVHLEYLDWNGELCGYTATKVVVGHFNGFRHVVSLPVSPLLYHKTAPEIRARLTERGRKFESLRGYHFQSCQGTKILLETKCPEERPVDGRVIVDAYAYYSSNNIVKPKLAPLKKEETDGENGVQENGSESWKSNDSSDDSRMAIGPAMTAVKANRNNARAEVLDHLTDEECFLATPWVMGLDLKTKEWGTQSTNTTGLPAD